MALSEDQKAMLRLLAQRGDQGYDDLAALKGLSVDAVRDRVGEAIEQLEAEGLPAPIPSPRAPRPAAEEPAEPKPPAPPEPKAAEPTPPAPGEEPASSPPAATPEAAATPAAPARPKPAVGAAARKASPSSSSRPRPSLPAGRGARAAIAAGVVVVIAVVVILLVSGGGDDSGSATTSSGGAAEGAASTAANSKQPTKATLEPVNGGDAEGEALFGRIKNSLALQLKASGLEPTAKGQSYTVWIAQSLQKMLPLAETGVGKSGEIAAQIAIPNEVLRYLAAGTFTHVYLTQTKSAALRASLTKATKENKSPAYTGTPVLQGTITGPIVGAAKKSKE